MQPQSANHQMTVDDLIGQWNFDVALMAKVWPTKYAGQNERFIDFYIATIGSHYADWLAKTIPFVRHYAGQYAIMERLQAEVLSGNSDKLLLHDSWDSPPLGDVRSHIANIRSFLKNPDYSGLNGLMVAAMIENSLPLIFRIINSISMLGLLTYHLNNKFAVALEGELSRGYDSEAHFQMGKTREAVHCLLKDLFTPFDPTIKAT